MSNNHHNTITIPVKNFKTPPINGIAPRIYPNPLIINVSTTLIIIKSIVFPIPTDDPAFVRAESQDVRVKVNTKKNEFIPKIKSLLFSFIL